MTNNEKAVPVIIGRTVLSNNGAVEALTKNDDKQLHIMLLIPGIKF